MSYRLTARLGFKLLGAKITKFNGRFEAIPPHTVDEAIPLKVYSTQIKQGG